jgi:hypothetical protein
LKLFDVVGALVVAAWVVLAGMYVYDAEFSEPSAAQGIDGEFSMHEGETWLVLRREGKEVGFVHQTRTDLGDGWLLEYDMLMTIQLLGTERAIDTTVKSRLDTEGYLTEFTADVKASGRSFKAKGEVDGKTISTTLNLLGEPKTQTIELQDKPRLSTSAFNQLLASGDIEAGDEFSERFFDPTTMQMTEMVMLYKGKKTVDVYEEKVPAHHILQKVAGNELDVYVDDKGEILIQEFPLRMVGARVPAELGRTRASSIRRKLEERQKQQKNKPGAGQFDFNLGTAMELLGGQVAPEKVGIGAPDEAKEADDAEDTQQADDKTDDSGTDEAAGSNEDNAGTD